MQSKQLFMGQGEIFVRQKRSKMKKLILVMVLGLVLSGCVTYSHYGSAPKEFEFRFVKRLFFNTYHLQIINHSPKRTVEFRCNPVGSNNYYVELNNGAKVSFDSKVFYYIGAKGIYWVNSGKTGSIPFEIKESVMQNAREIVFKGRIFIARHEGYFLHQDDMRELIVTVNIADGKITVTEGYRIEIPQINGSLIFEEGLSSENKIPDVRLIKNQFERETPKGFSLQGDSPADLQKLIQK